jgi:hypothetical protein
MGVITSLFKLNFILMFDFGVEMLDLMLAKG